MTDTAGLKALVVYESFFGNTESIARAANSGHRRSVRMSANRLGSR